MKSPELANRLAAAAAAVKLQGKSPLSAQLDFHAEIMSKQAGRA